jgi:dihydroorotase
VKSYPKGVTTNSESGIESYRAYYPVFKAMEEENLVLNLHGEVPSDPDKVENGNHVKPEV